jgi:phosphoribosylanthranilate isomerase
VAAANAGADAIGMIFHPAAGRFVSIELAKQIAAAVPPFVSVVGVFVDADFDAVWRILDQVPLSTVQLHGSETPRLVHDLKPIPVIKAIKVEGDGALQHWRSANKDLNLTNLMGILMETPNTCVPGGSGVPNDWNAILTLQRAGRFTELPPLVVAGGLTPDNVGGVVRLLRPYAVDVSSGVESIKREKSVEKIKAFVQAVREADYDPGQ